MCCYERTPLIKLVPKAARSPNARLTLNKSQLSSSISYRGVQAFIQHFYCTCLPNEIDVGNIVTLGQIMPIHPWTVNATERQKQGYLGEKGKQPIHGN